jgi:enoyl-CoA hydratase/carnithine racemase
MSTATGPPVLTTMEQAGNVSVAHIVLNRPQARNAITVALARGLTDALRAAAAQAEVIVIRGAGGHFCAGGDFREVSRLRAQGPEALRALFEEFLAACALIGELAVAELTANLAGKDAAALARAKRLVREGLAMPLRDGLALETETIIAHLGGAAAAAGISRFTHRERPPGQQTGESS